MRMRHAIRFTLLFVLLSLGQGAWAADFVEGKDYQRIDPPLPTDTEGKVEVAEYFWYACPHCFHMEPAVTQWRATMPDTAIFRRVAADFDGRWALLSRAYYTAEVLGVLDRIHHPLFEAIHVKKQHFRDEAQLAEFFQEFGVSAEEFSKAFHSFTVESKYRRAVSLTRRSGIDGVPAIIVNGKYRTSASLAGGNKRMFQVVDYLINKETAAQ